jgi:hypothetical protein
VSQRHRHRYAADLLCGLPGLLKESSREVPAAKRPGGTHRARPLSTRFEPVHVDKGRKNTGSLRTPFRHARRTRPIWQYWHVPALSGLLPPSPAPPGSPGPTAAIVDSQSVEAAEEVARSSRSYDAGKKVNGRYFELAFRSSL